MSTNRFNVKIVYCFIGERFVLRKLFKGEYYLPQFGKVLYNSKSVLTIAC